MGAMTQVRAATALVVCTLLLVAAVGHGAAPPAAGPVRLDLTQHLQMVALGTQLYRAGAAGRFEDAEQLALRLVTLREQWLGKGHWQTRDARVLAEQWRLRAKVAPPHRRDVARAWTLLGEAGTLQANFRHRQAEALQREALALCRKALGDHPDTADCCDHLATNLEAQGQHAQAQPLREEALKIRRAALGPEHPRTVQYAINVGANLNGQGKYAQAQPVLEPVLALCRKVLGARHPGTALACNELAFSLNLQGKHRQAQPLYEEALRMRRKVLGERDRATAQSCNNLAACLRDQGRQVEAHPLLEQALAIDRQVLGEEHPVTAYGYNNLAGNLAEQGQYALAQPLFEKALVSFRKRFGEQHPSTAACYSNLGANLDAQGRHAQAQVLLEKALAVDRQVRGDDHLDVARGYNNLAFNLHAQGRFAQAQPLFDRALAIHVKVRGEKHPQTAVCCNNAASNLDDQGKHRQAEALHEKALAIRRQALGEEHRHTAQSYGNLALCLTEQGRYAEALRLYEKALRAYRQAPGKGHPDTALCCCNLAANQASQGKHAEAQPLYEEALALCRRTLGEDHPQTANIINSLAHNLVAQGKLPQAVRLWQSSLPGQEVARFNTSSTGFGRALATARRGTARAALAVGLARLGQPRNAFRHAEASLARGLLDDLPGTKGSAGPRLTSLASRLRALDGRLLALFGRATLSEDQERLRDELSQQRRRVLSELAGMTADLSARQVLPLERIQGCLPGDVALLIWLEVRGMGAPLAGVVRPRGRPVWLPLKGRGASGAWTSADADLPARLYRALQDPGSGSAERNRLVTALRQQLLGPVRPLLRAQGSLPAVRHLFVVATGALGLVPLETLADDYQVSYVPSGSVLARLLDQHRPLTANHLLALGDPVFRPADSKPPEPPAKGLLLSAVLPGGPAARAGLQAGDVVMAFGPQSVGTLVELKQALANGPGRVRYWRDGRAERTVPLPGGNLGVTIDPQPPRQAVPRWREQSASPVPRGTGHKPLPGSADEVNALAALVKDSTKLVGSRASEQELDQLLESGRLKEYRLLHFATHGEVDEADPDRSRLILAQDHLPDPRRLRAGQKRHTGELTVRAIRETWQLDADLVVLSACRTALGKDAGGEGLLGFAHAFLSCGARAVVLSRWKVDDGATALLMVRFYENLLGSRKGTKPLGRARALQEAKTWLRGLPRGEAMKLAAALRARPLAGSRGTEKDALPTRKVKHAQLPEGERPFAHPYFWAAFTLLGDPN
jgi:tetratricopeptide (TPR) repeat protein